MMAATYVPGDSSAALGQRTGPATVAAVLDELEQQVLSGEAGSLAALPTGYQPLDDILNGGVRPGELLILGGPQGVGKTIFGLQAARSAVVNDKKARAVYVCYEHDRTHLLMRLLCLESAEQGLKDEALTMRALSQMALEATAGTGLLARLRKNPRHAAVLDAVAGYMDRLVLVKASGESSTLEVIYDWIRELYPAGPGRLLLAVDYLQKIPVSQGDIQPEAEVTTHLTQGLKEMAMSLGVAVLAISASDREGLKSRRMRFYDLRGSSALQYEADIGLVLNNKYAIVSREHMVYNPVQAESMRNWVVVTVEKNRAGRHSVDLEFAFDGAHFRIVPAGNVVRERLIDEKVVLT